MKAAGKQGRVRSWEERVIIPTYPVQNADQNPMFLEKRVYQGSSGKVYPNPFTDRVALEKQDQSYDAIFLENEFVQLMMLPEIGGRIHAGLDKTNQYDFFYRQRVIKPALVGLLGPWISGGVEFNWPQHHRPSTYMPAHAAIEEHLDGGCTVWMSEHDPMLRMKGMVGVCLHPGRSLIEVKVRLFNRTPLAQTFLWWANVAVHVNDQYQAFFPPDVTFVADHAKRAMSSFPIARNHYYGVDYRPGTDISWYKNIPVPTSYMVTESKYDFFGGYDHGREAGVIHTSNHHIAPGKKLWTWGNAEFGYAWDRNLTDSDGPYVELMAGAYTDNQPDFSWLEPYETKTFRQFWSPIQKIGPAKNANTEAAVNLEISEDSVKIGVCATSPREVRVVLARDGANALDEQVSLAPDKPFLKKLNVGGIAPEKHTLLVFDATGKELIRYQPVQHVEGKLPDAATEPLEPRKIPTTEELYLTGLHLEQYRHATRSPETYWLEGLEREPENARLNCVIGLFHLRKGEFARAENYFQQAVRRLTFRNPNPQDGAPHYYLGLTRMYQGKTLPAYEAYYKSTWAYAWRSAGYYALAAITAQREEWETALDHVDMSLRTNTENLSARALRVLLLRHLGRKTEAQEAIDESFTLDRMDFRMHAERFLLTRRDEDFAALVEGLDGDLQTLLDVAFDLSWSGGRDEAGHLLEQCVRVERWDHPMVWYTLAWLSESLADKLKAQSYAARAEAAPSRYCFPARIEEMIVLESAIARNPASAKAHAYLGNLYYDKRRFDDAIRCWRRSVELDGSYSIPWRNLGIAEFNVLHNAGAAEQMYERALAANDDDARLLYEWDQLRKRIGLASAEDRLSALDARPELVRRRDDLTIERVTLLNRLGRWEEALSTLSARQFCPWEGGEGLPSAQYVGAHRALGLAALKAENPIGALTHFEAARVYSHNLGEGKHLLTLQRDLDYFSGVAADHLGDVEKARTYWTAGSGPLPSPSVHTYFRALSLRALGEEEACRATLEEVARFAQEKAKETPRIDYFATSLPNLLLFDDDLKKRGRVEATALMGLAAHGLGEHAKAVALLRQATDEDPDYLIVLDALRWITRDRALETKARSVS